MDPKLKPNSKELRNYFCRKSLNVYHPLVHFNSDILKRPSHIS